MTRLNRDDIDKFFDYDIHIPTRTIYMGSDVEDAHELGVNAGMAERIIKGLHLLDSSAPNGDKPITIIMDNMGGDWYHGMAIYDAIKGCVNHVTIRVKGYAMSMGAVILQAADERIMSPNSKLMIHYGTTSIEGAHTKIFRNWSEEVKKIDNDMLDIFLNRIQVKHPNFSKKKIDEMCNFDTILSSKEAVDLGLTDKVE